MSDYLYTPLPFNVTPASPLFQLSPSASNITQGWVPSCSTPDCVPTASWSTSSIGATLAFQYWGWDVAFDGNVKGNMSVEFLLDGISKTWNPSTDMLFRLHGEGTDSLRPQNLTLKVLDASPDSELTIKQARVNGSSFTANVWGSDRWIVPSNDTRLSYTGFVQQPSSIQAGSQTTYVSSKAGNTMSTQFNGSALLIHGPCGPTNGLVKVKIGSQEATVNTSKPIPSDDCLIFQSWGFPSTAMHELRVENVNGATLGINRVELFLVSPFVNKSNGRDPGGALVAGIVIVVVFTVLAVVIITFRFKKKKMVVRETKLAYP
ncbi:hypothetical protein RSOLAG22IIIB_10721 [Rhizoctonia solani]|uniref:Uncharacterized protein n=1 Tax=Rhizoctonia solani TaxID=456999 RepID=A0A0K6G4C0_9AGAM|nr:hypothetical protein RSOLAG22IIIB_10721 [Rhizoctonia solani]